MLEQEDQSIQVVSANDNWSDRLTNKFNSAQKRFFEDMEFVAETQDEQLPEFFENIPVWDQGKWSRDYSNNCYNFALNRKTNDFLQPGDINVYPELATEDYINKIIKNTANDNLRPLKYSFMECRADEIPVALFFRPRTENQSNDFHWFALRKNKRPKNNLSYIWAHKQGARNAEITEDKIFSDKKLGHIDIFNSASQYNYNHFAGFFATPKHAEPIKKTSGLIYFLNSFKR